MFFSLCGGKLEDALLIYSSMINEPIEVDPAVEALPHVPLVFVPFPDPPLKEGLKEIERELLKKLGVVIRRRKGKVYAELKSGPTKGVARKRPVEKPLHDVVLQIKESALLRWGDDRWPGEQCRKRLKNGTVEIHLRVPNLDPVTSWVMGLFESAYVVAPPELQRMLFDIATKMLENMKKPRPGSDDSFAA